MKVVKTSIFDNYEGSTLPTVWEGQLIHFQGNLYFWDETEYKQLIKFGDFGTIIIDSVADYSSLPSAATNTGKLFYVSNSQGTQWLPWTLGGTYYPKGGYISNGTTWNYIGEFPVNSTQAEVDTGTSTNTFITPSTLSAYSKWSTKQDTLNSSNLKTVGGISLLGTGDIPLIPSSGTGSYEHNQNTPSLTWNVNHNLNRKPAGIKILDSAGDENIGDVEYVDNNNLIMHFNGAFSGVGYFS